MFLAVAWNPYICVSIYVYIYGIHLYIKEDRTYVLLARLLSFVALSAVSRLTQEEDVAPVGLAAETECL